MNTPTNNPMDDDYSRDLAGCLIPAAILFVAFVFAAIMIIFS